MKRHVLMLLAIAFYLTGNNLRLHSQGLSVPQGKENVNLVTGDFSYSIPLLTVPGPDGGYPVILKYNAGIRVNQDASWVGLGWNLGVGAVNRIVENIPDDWLYMENPNTIYTNYGDMLGTSGFPIIYSSFDEENAHAMPHLYSNEYSKVLTSRQIKEANTRVFKSSIKAIGSANLSFVPNYSETRLPNPDLPIEWDWYRNHPNRSTYLKSTTTKRNFYRGTNFPAYDKYIVSANGLAGTFSPRMFYFGGRRRSTYRLKVRGNNDPDYLEDDINECPDCFTKWYEINNSLVDDIFLQDNPKHLDFYFDHDGTGYAEITDGKHKSYSYEMFGYKTYDESEDAGQLNLSSKGFFDETNLRKGSSKHIEPIWNKGITGSNSNGPIYQDEGYRINGFKITNEQGITYYFTQPVFQKFSLTQSIEVNPLSGHIPNTYEEYRPWKFPVKWMLTAVTGPNYIDHNENGEIDDHDEGYWVKFNYGKWCGAEINRTPSKTGEYSNFYYGGYKNCTYIGSDVFHLNTIETKTHIAYFIKNTNIGYKPELGGHDTEIMTHKSLQTGGSSYNLNGHSYSFVSPDITKLRLSKIILAKKGDLNISPSNGSALITQSTSKIQKKTYTMSYQIGSSTDWEHNNTYDIKTYNKHLNDNIIDVNDIEGMEDEIAGKAIKIIVFDHSTDLCKDPSTSTGKLTLDAIRFYANNNTEICPPFQFSYEPDNPDIEQVHGEKSDAWGFYYDNDENLLHEDINPKPNADAWCLQQITTPLGKKIKLQFESDVYKDEAATYIDDQIVRIPVNGLWNLINGTTVYCKNFKNSILNIGDECILKINNTIQEWIILDESISMEYKYINSNDNVIIGIINDNSVSVDKIISDQLLYQKIIDPNTLSYLQYTITGQEQNKYYGGGVRLKKIEYTDIDNNLQSYKTYTYYNGMTSYAPVHLQRYIPYVNELPEPSVYYRTVHEENFDKENNYLGCSKNEFNVFAGSTNTNGVEFSLNGYDNNDFFWVENKHYDDPTSPTYTDGDYGCGNTDWYSYDIFENFSSLLLHNNFASLGRLESTTISNKNGNILSKTEYDYYDPGEIENGLIQETFEEICNAKYKQRTRSCDYEDEPEKIIREDFYVNSSSRIMYPNLLKKTTTYSNGMSNTKEIVEYDFESGQPTVIKTDGPNESGDVYYTKRTPAYKINPGDETTAGMGHKFYNLENKNTLVQNAATYKFYANTNNSNVINTNLNHWSNNLVVTGFNLSAGSYQDEINNSYFKPIRNIGWEGNIDQTTGKYLSFLPIENNEWQQFDDGFKWDSWYSNSKTTRYSKNMTPIERVDINGIHSASKLGFENSKTIASATNARYTEFTFSSFEYNHGYDWKDWFNGDIVKNPNFGEMMVSAKYADDYPEHNLIENINAHTGKFYIKQINEWGPVYKVHYDLGSETVNTGFIPGKKYCFKVWVHEESESDFTLVAHLQGSNNDQYDFSDNVIAEAGKWKLYYLETEIPANVSSGYISFYVRKLGPGSIYYDDFLVKPVDAKVSASVYDQRKGQLLAELDNNHFAVKYEYNNDGRLSKVYNETEDGFVKVKDYMYNIVNEAPQPPQSFNVESINGLDVVYGGFDTYYSIIVSPENENYTYNWYKGPIGGDGVYIGMGDNITVPLRESENSFFIKCIVSNGISETSITKNITVRELTLSGSNNLEECANETYSVCSNPPPGGYTYHWKKGRPGTQLIDYGGNTPSVDVPTNANSNNFEIKCIVVDDYSGDQTTLSKIVNVMHPGFSSSWEGDNPSDEYYETEYEVNISNDINCSYTLSWHMYDENSNLISNLSGSQGITTPGPIELSFTFNSSNYNNQDNFDLFIKVKDQQGNIHYQKDYDIIVRFFSHP